MCVPAAKKGVIGVAVDKCVSLGSLAVVFAHRGVATQEHIPSMPGNFFPRRDIVRDGAKTRWDSGFAGMEMEEEEEK